jgi:hypothetical protein
MLNLRYMDSQQVRAHNQHKLLSLPLTTYKKYNE